MDQIWVRNYIEKYLTTQQCHFVEKGPGHIQVKLSPEADKALTNRSYYWAFVERTGAEPETLQMNFIFDPEQAPEDLRGEKINFGSTRLQQIFHSAQKHGSIVRLYQQFQQPNKYFKKTQNSTAVKSLHPWLAVNYKVEFLSDKKKDKIISIGINLGTGDMKDKFYDRLKQLNLGPVLPANVSVNPHFINFREAALQLEEWILHEVSKEDFKWAIEAKQRLEEEVELLNNYYYMHDDQKDDLSDEQKEILQQKLVEKENRLEEIKWQYTPRVDVKPINYGVFYLDDLVLKNVEYMH